MNVIAASPWVVAALDAVWGQTPVPSGLRALDLACGQGRHSQLLARRGFAVLAVDRLVPELDHWSDRVAFKALDLETDHWPLDGEHFDCVVVTNYLYRPHFEALKATVKPGGCLIIETFMAGNAQFGSPKNPDFLLNPGELLERLQGWQIVRFEQGLRQHSTPAMIQRVVAIAGPWTGIQSIPKTSL